MNIIPNSGWRSLFWRTAVVGMLLLPVAVATLPETPIAVSSVSAPPPVHALIEASRRDEPRAAAKQTISSNRVLQSADKPALAPTVFPHLPAAETQVQSLSWTEIALAIYLFGVVVMVGRLALGLYHTAILRRRSTPVADPWIAELHRLRAVCGIRRDVGYWCHPLVWLAARRWQQTSEQVCDDVVVEVRGFVSDYTDALISIATGLKGRRAIVLAASMAVDEHRIPGATHPRPRR